jgi:hypothetical protein
MYYVILTDKDGCEMAAHYDIVGLKAAKGIAKGYLSDPEYKNDAHKVEVRNSGDDCCEWDKFAA